MERGLRILFLHDRLSAKGGADRYLLGLLDHLAPEQETFLAVGKDDGSVPEAQRKRLGPWRKISGLGRRGLKTKSSHATQKSLSALVKEFKPDLIHLHNIMHPDLIRLAAESGPSLMTVQDHRLFCPGAGKLTPSGEVCRQVLGPPCGSCLKDKGYASRLLRLTLERLQAASKLRAVHVLSNYMASELSMAWQSRGLTAPRLEVIPPFVHGLKAPDRSKQRKHHLLACRLSARKGVRVALKAASLLQGGESLLIAGDGRLAPDVARAAELSQGRIKYAGWAGRHDMARHLAGALSLWAPSLWAEPFGIVGLEAGFMGAPVIATPVGGTGDWLHNGKNGLLVDPGDAAGLARAADSLARDRNKAERMGQAGTCMVKGIFRPSRLAQAVCNLYLTVTI